jgi:hypothetical protein
MSKPSTTMAILLLFSTGLGCAAPQHSTSRPRSDEGSDVGALLHAGMTDQQALDALGITGPVTYVGGLGGGSRMVRSPKLPGHWIVLHIGRSEDGDPHLLDWSTSPL